MRFLHPFNRYYFKEHNSSTIKPNINYACAMACNSPQKTQKALRYLPFQHVCRVFDCSKAHESSRLESVTKTRHPPGSRALLFRNKAFDPAAVYSEALSIPLQTHRFPSPPLKQRKHSVFHDVTGSLAPSPRRFSPPASACVLAGPGSVAAHGCICARTDLHSRKFTYT